MAATSVYTLNNGAQGVEEHRLKHQHKTLFTPITKTLLPDFISAHLNSLGRPPAVADVATGTGIWLQDLAAELSPDARLDGYDFDTCKYPSPDKLPSNVKLCFGDGLKPFPEDRLGQYDLVHVRLLVFGLEAHQWEEMAGSLRTLLRPGGFLFWDESGYPGFSCLPMTESFFKWFGTEVRYASSVGRDITAPMGLLDQIKNQGFVNCSLMTFSMYSQPKELQKDGARTLLLGIRQSLRGMVAKGGFEWAQTNDDVDRVVQAMTDDVENDRCVSGSEIYWTIGQNPGKEEQPFKSTWLGRRLAAIAARWNAK